MLTERVKAILTQIDELTDEEQIYLRRELDIRAQSKKKNNPRYDLERFAGIAPYPLLGEDAQQWISRTRLEDTEHRERHLGRSYED